MRFRWYEGRASTAVLWWCPGCDEVHQITVGGEKGWSFSGTREAPTFSPSILTRGVKVCHSYMEAGKMRFLSDCNHALAGQTVEVGELPEWWRE